MKLCIVAKVRILNSTCINDVIERARFHQFLDFLVEFHGVHICKYCFSASWFSVFATISFGPGATKFNIRIPPVLVFYMLCFFGPYSVLTKATLLASSPRTSTCFP